MHTQKYDALIEAGAPLGRRATGASGRKRRKGIGVVDAVRIFGDPRNAALWMEKARWDDGPGHLPEVRKRPRNPHDTKG